MESLQRTKVDTFSLNNAISMEELKNDVQIVNDKIIKIEDIFKNKEKINLDNKKAELLLNGVKLNLSKEDGIYTLYNQDKFLGLGIIKNNLLKRDVIII